MYFFIRLIPVFAVIMMFGCSGKENSASAWKLVFQNDLNGKAIYGSRKDLATALKRGSPIRVSWGEKLGNNTTCVEFAVPDFITLMNDSNVVVQFPVSMIQTDYLDAKKAMLKTNPPTEWRALMSTDGHYHQFHTKLGSDSITRVMYLRANMSWYAYLPGEDDRYIPDLALPGGIILDSIE